MSPRALAWLDAVRTPSVAADLESIFGRAAEAIAARGPACWASGRCCNFAAAGHRLYVTGLETAYCVDRLPGAGASSEPGPGAGVVSLPQALPSARSRGLCPFQRANLCTVHAIKPVACRVYFCDRSAQDWQHELSESLLADLRALHDRHGIDYRYADWLDLLAEFAERA
jgi:Fe-S-cluster containining protein